MEARDYQVKAIEMVRSCIRNKSKRIGVMAPTGSGKGFIAEEIIEMALNKGNRAAFICDKLTLIDQTCERFDFRGFDYGVIQGDHPKHNSVASVQICSMQTLANRDINAIDVFIVDEFHAQYKALTAIMDKNPNAIFIGFSASPFSKGLGKVWDELVVVVTTQELIDQGHLVGYDAYGPSKPDMKGVKTTAGDFNQKQSAERSDKPKLIADIVKTWLDIGENSQTICFATNILHSKHIVDEFIKNGITATHIDAYTDSKDRRDILKRFKNSEIKIVSSVDVLTKGYDNPSAKCMIDAKPTKSLIAHVQKTGRVLRTFPGKEKAIILDHSGNIERLGHVTDPLPNVMCRGEKKVAELKPKEEKLPKTCGKCDYLKPVGVHECPKCGYKPEKQNTVETEAGELVKIGKTKKSATMEDKQLWYSMFLGYAARKKYNPGWVAHKYKEKFTVWPKGLQKIATTATPEFSRYVQYLNIKASKTKRASAN